MALGSVQTPLSLAFSSELCQLLRSGFPTTALSRPSSLSLHYSRPSHPSPDLPGEHSTHLSASKLFVFFMFMAKHTYGKIK